MVGGRGLCARPPLAILLFTIFLLTIFRGSVPFPVSSALLVARQVRLPPPVCMVLAGMTHSSSNQMGVQDLRPRAVVEICKSEDTVNVGIIRSSHVYMIGSERLLPLLPLFESLDCSLYNVYDWTHVYTYMYKDEYRIIINEYVSV